MRQLPLPAIDDLAALDNLEKSWAAHAKAIRAQLPTIREQYVEYSDKRGDPWVVAANPGLAAFREHLENLYKTPPTALKHVKAIRDGLAGACPMCGRDALGTLDHYLPQSNYPDFCFFSRNLVPACNRCNTARGNSVMGANVGQRALHPYFDTFAARQVMTVELMPDWRAPAIRPVPFDVDGATLKVIQWQIDNVVIPSGFIEYAAPIWGTFVDNPLAIFAPIPTIAAVTTKLEELERAEMALSRSKNGWRSCIYHGVRSNQHAVAFLVDRVHEAMQYIR